MSVRGDAVPPVSRGAVLKEGRYDLNESFVESQLGEHYPQDSVMNGREELSNVQCKDQGMEPAVAVLCDVVDEDQSNISGGVLADAPKLSLVEEPECLAIELEASCQHFGEKLAQRVEERDGAEGLGNVVGGFLGLGDDGRPGVLEFHACLCLTLGS